MTRSLSEELPRPQRLALSYAPAAVRPATLALLALDARLAAAVRRRGEPVLAQMRLAWWRDTLSSDPQAWPRGDEVLGLLGEWRDPAALVPLVDGWEAILGEELDTAAIEQIARGRGAAFGQLARELGEEPEPAEACARLWALGDLAANLSQPSERMRVVAAARGLPRPRLPRRLRPLAALAGLAQRSLARGGTPLLDGPRAVLVALRLGIGGR
jgi:phytoene synthase